jgi:alcohol dehydrogenase YqhD (iron-dependent ADH family)
LNNFVFQNPTKIYFGRDQLKCLKTGIPKYVNNILLVYGKYSIKKNGLYDKVLEQLNSIEVEIHELSGVEPNPRLSMVYEGIEICRRNKIDFILAVGGGSVIDCTKAIAAGSKQQDDVWESIKKLKRAKDGLPFGTVLTLAGTGSEMNSNTVITNWSTREKYGWEGPALFPVFSILDPVHTYTLPPLQTVYGIVDIMTHVLEQYFHEESNTPLQTRMCESVLKTVIETAPFLLKTPNSYELRETIMLCGTIAWNGTLQMGTCGSWVAHHIEHAVSGIYDIPHGGGLSILFPNWMEYVLEVNVNKFKRLAVEVFNVDPNNKSDKEVGLIGIRELRKFWNRLGAPNHLAHYNIDNSCIEGIVKKSMIYGPFGKFKRFYEEDVKELLRMSL